MVKINSIESEDYQAVFRWDEYQNVDPRFMQGILMEHYKRHEYGDERFRAEDGTVKLLFDDDPEGEDRTHSVLVTDADIYSKVEVAHDGYDPDMEDARHQSIMTDRMDALHGRAQAAASLYEALTDVGHENADELLALLEEGPLMDEDDLAERSTWYALDAETVMDAIGDEAVVFPDTEQTSKQRSMADYTLETKSGETMREIYANVIDVVSAAYHQDHVFE